MAFDATVPEVALDMSEFLDKVVRCPLCNDRCPEWFRQCFSVFSSGGTVGGRCPCYFLQLPCRGAEALPMVQTVLRTIAIPQSFLDKKVNAPVMQGSMPSKSLS